MEFAMMLRSCCAAHSYPPSEPPRYRRNPLVPFPALAWLLTGNQQYLDAARRWSLAACGYPHWGLGTEDGSDLAAGHQLYGLALVYDWLYSSLDPEAGATARVWIDLSLERFRLTEAALGPDGASHEGAD
jgi:hypothetical protein